MFTFRNVVAVHSTLDTHTPTHSHNHTKQLTEPTSSSSTSSHNDFSCKTSAKYTQNNLFLKRKLMCTETCSICGSRHRARTLFRTAAIYQVAVGGLLCFRIFNCCCCSQLLDHHCQCPSVSFVGRVAVRRCPLPPPFSTELFAHAFDGLVFIGAHMSGHMCLKFVSFTSSVPFWLVRLSPF